MLCTDLKSMVMLNVMLNVKLKWKNNNKKKIAWWDQEEIKNSIKNASTSRKKLFLEFI